MNVYFACSITGGREVEAVYQALTQALAEDHHVVPTAHLARSNVHLLEGTVDPKDVYERDVSWILACDALVAEVSVPSHGVGYEIGFALGEAKPVLCLAEEGRAVSKMITGNPHPGLKVRRYRDASEGVRLLRTFLDELAHL
jgi:nucleoside 2-deoxyribosyltransferase